MMQNSFKKKASPERGLPCFFVILGDREKPGDLHHAVDTDDFADDLDIVRTDNVIVFFVFRMQADLCQVLKVTFDRRVGTVHVIVEEGNDDIAVIGRLLLANHD